jgi:hypothetical protein
MTESKFFQQFFSVVQILRKNFLIEYFRIIVLQILKWLKLNNTLFSCYPDFPSQALTTYTHLIPEISPLLYRSKIGVLSYIQHGSKYSGK